jgi:hypothetical protein
VAEICAGILLRSTQTTEEYTETEFIVFVGEEGIFGTLNILEHAHLSFC